MSSIKEVAEGIVSLVKAGKFHEAIDAYYSPDIVSAEPMGEPAVVKGIEAVYGKTAWWEDNFAVNKTEVKGPYFNGDQFILDYSLNITNKKTGEQSDMNEYAVYTVSEGKIVDERFFYIPAK